ncbi:hypothetical protein NQZ68_038145 [Dissostichus eleginoides]|nr:hypothetical protein NQZ68_038145 [Dissostichus eleginoides]
MPANKRGSMQPGIVKDEAVVSMAVPTIEGTEVQTSASAGLVNCSQGVTGG